MDEDDKLLFGSDSEEEEEGKKTTTEAEGKPAEAEGTDKDKDENAGDGGEGDPQTQVQEKKADEEKRVEDLFGSDSDEEEEEGNDGTKLGGGENEERAADDEPEELYEFDLAKDQTVGSLNATRDELFLSKFINSVDAEAFDAGTFDPSYSQGVSEEQLTVRWRKATTKEQKEKLSGAEAALGMESNARVVKWSDGSMTLQVGDEHIDLLTRDITVGTSLVCCKHGRTDKHKLFLESQEVLSKRVTFRPFSIKSKAHSLLSKEAVKSKVKSNQSKKITVKENPRLMQLEREKEEEAKIKQQELLQRKQEKVMAKYGYTSFDDDRNDSNRDLSVRYLEEGMEMDEDGTEWDEDATRRAREALAGTRRTRQSMADHPQDGDQAGGEEMTEEEQTAKRQMFSRGLDESDEETGQEKNPSSLRGKAVLMSDDEDD